MPCAAAIWLRRAGSGGTGTGNRSAPAGWPVRNRSRQEHQRARPRPPLPVAAESFELTVQDEERLFLRLVNVGRRREAGYDSGASAASPTSEVYAA